MDETANGRGGTIVVGLDGSTHAEEALRYAVDEAALRGLGVRVVVAHEPPDAWMADFGMPLVADDGGLRRAVEDSARARVEELRGTMDAAEQAVPVEVLAVSGSPAHVLVQEAEDAVLLVVGHRGRGGLRSRLLGSVGLAVVLRAPCPVTVVPPPRAAEETTPKDAAALAGPLAAGPLA